MGTGGHVLGGCGDADMEGGTLKQAMEQQFDGSYVREHDGAARYNEIVINTQFWERSLRAYPAHQHAMPDPSVDPAHCMPSLNPICIIAMPISPKFRLGTTACARATPILVQESPRVGTLLAHHRLPSFTLWRTLDSIVCMRVSSLGDRGLLHHLAGREHVAAQAWPWRRVEPRGDAASARGLFAAVWAHRRGGATPVLQVFADVDGLGSTGECKPAAHR